VKNVSLSSTAPSAYWTVMPVSVWNFSIVGNDFLSSLMSM
jgi:hypothetical protein